MSEPIASRSHFNVIYKQETDRYYLMDAGSKWGTFVKIGSSMTLSCGDWIRVGGAEFFIRFCGGGCNCSKNHAHHRMRTVHGLQQEKCGQSNWGWTARPHGQGEQMDGQDLDTSRCGGVDDQASDDDESLLLQEDLLALRASRRPKGWTTSSSRLCQRGAQLLCQPRGHTLPRLALPTSCVPIAPLELDFISGPRIGEKLVLCEKVCTLGRGEGNTIQVSDSQLASVSRVHCIFEFIGDRWHIRDNGSTNGTWRRLSCVLEPSAPVPVDGVMSIQAGTHEFYAKEAEMRQKFIPSLVVSALEDLCEQERRINNFPAED